MRCMNCGLPLSPERNLANCPRCGAPLNVLQGAQQQQFEQAGWGNMGGMPQQNPWGQTAFPQQEQPGQMGSSSFNRGMMGSGLQQTPFPSRRPYTPAKSKSNPRLLFIVAGLCVVLGAVILGVVAMIAASNHGSSPNAAQNSSNTSATQRPSASPTASGANASPTVSDSPTATGTSYPGQQYIDGAQMAMGVDKHTMQPQQPTTTFKVGSTMYVVFNLHPPSQGGAVCAYWYLSGKQVTSFASAVKGSNHASYTYAIYGNPGSAYVELYWASDKSCSDKVLAQHVDFTVTA